MTPQIYFLFIIGASIWTGIICFFLGRWYECDQDIKKLIKIKKSQEKYLNYCEECGGNPELELVFSREEALLKTKGYNHSEPLSAFTVTELGEMLPDTECIRDTKVNKSWGCDVLSSRTIADTEADARAKMLIYLIENKLISL